MSNLYEIFSKIRNKAQNWHYSLLEACDKDFETKNLYFGTQIFLSPLFENPHLLIIGINPGYGFYKDNGYRSELFDPLENMNYIERDEYGEYLYNDSISRETRKCFESAGILHILESDAIKTNVFYQSTQDAGDLPKLINKARTAGVDLLQNIWVTKLLIEAINPRVILIEGEKALEYLTKHLRFEKIGTRNRYSDNTSIGTLNDKLAIRYKRRYSNIINPMELTTALYEVLS